MNSSLPAPTLWQMEKPRNPLDLVEERIQEAIARGEFDNLPTQGQRIDLDENPYVPADWRLACRSSCSG